MKIKIISSVRLGGQSAKPGTVAEVADQVGYDLIHRARAEAVLPQKAASEADSAEPKTNSESKDANPKKEGKK